MWSKKRQRQRSNFYQTGPSITESTTYVPRIHTEESFVADQFRLLSLTLASGVNELVKRTRKGSTRASPFGTRSPLIKINSLTYSIFWVENCFLWNFNLLLKWQKVWFINFCYFFLGKGYLKALSEAKKPPLYYCPAQ